MNKQFHWFENFDDIGRALWSGGLLGEAAVGCGFYHTNHLINDDVPLIVSDQSYFFSQSTIDRGYTLFAHFTDGTTTEVRRGAISPSGREITAAQNLEKLLLAGEFR